MCSIRVCHRDFLTQEHTQKHLEIEHFEIEDIYLEFLKDTYRQLNLLFMRAIRARAKKA